MFSVPRILAVVVLVFGGLCAIQWPEFVYQPLEYEATVKPFTGKMFVIASMILILKTYGLILQSKILCSIQIVFIAIYVIQILGNMQFTEEIKTLSYNFPSWGTLAGFLLLNFRGIETKDREVYLILCFTLSLSGVLGYALDMPLLYFYVENRSTAMSISTAIFMLILCTGFFIQKGYEVSSRGR